MLGRCAVLLSVTWQGYDWYIGALLGVVKESETKTKAILSALPDLMFLLDEDGTYLDWYATDPANLYAPPEQFLGKNMREILPSELAGEPGPVRSWNTEYEGAASPPGRTSGLRVQRRRRSACGGGTASDRGF